MSDIAERDSRIRHLQVRQAIVFCGLCCCRMIPSYRKFQQAEHWGDYDGLVSVLDRVWDHVYGKAISVREAAELRNLCEGALPDTENHASPFTSAALSVVSALHETLEFIADAQTSHVIQVATLATDSVDLHIQLVEPLDAWGPTMEQAIQHHPLMQREVHRQLEDLSDLARLNHFTADALQPFRSRSSYDLLGA